MPSCEKCGSHDLINLSLTLSGGPVAFSSCRSCEHRRWTDAEQGGALPLPEVLGKVSR